MRGITVLVAGLLVAACNMTSRMEVPVVKAPDLVPVEQDRKLATVAFSKAVMALRRGTIIAHFPGGGMDYVDAGYCNNKYPTDSHLVWGGGRLNFGDYESETAEVFYETMNAAGFSVVGDPKIMFGRDRERSKAAYRIGARITEIRGNICEESHWTDGRPLDRFAGEMYYKVEWSIYSNVLEKTVARFETESYMLEKIALRGGVTRLLLSAFASATEVLAAKKEFRDLLSTRQKEYDVDAGKRRFAELAIRDIPLSRRPVRRLTHQIVTATVTIGVGEGHGSGFVITSNGHILTNSHVVEESKEVTVIFSNGIKVTGRVLRGDAIRDVALVKVDVRGIQPFPIRLEPELEVFDTVYAVGTPKKRFLRATITKGIVSAFRTEKETNINYIQSNVDIAGGSSGGPLIDEFGNVVGVSVSLYGPTGKFSSGLNMFIPIDEALTALNIEKKTKKKKVGN